MGKALCKGPIPLGCAALPHATTMMLPRHPWQWEGTGGRGACRLPRTCRHICHVRRTSPWEAWHRLGRARAREYVHAPSAHRPNLPPLYPPPPPPRLALVIVWSAPASDSGARARPCAWDAGVAGRHIITWSNSDGWIDKRALCSAWVRTPACPSGSAPRAYEGAWWARRAPPQFGPNDLRQCFLSWRDRHRDQSVGKGTSPLKVSASA